MNFKIHVPPQSRCSDSEWGGIFCLVCFVTLKGAAVFEINYARTSSQGGMRVLRQIVWSVGGRAWGFREQQEFSLLSPVDLQRSAAESGPFRRECLGACEDSAGREALIDRIKSDPLQYSFSQNIYKFVELKASFSVDSSVLSFLSQEIVPNLK